MTADPSLQTPAPATAPGALIGSVLETLLSSYQLRVRIIADVRYCGSWYEEEPATRQGQFHVIGEGQCQVSAAVLPQPLLLQGGDLVIFPHGTRHSLCAPPTTAQAPASDYTSMLCGEMEFVAGPHNPILAALPQCMVVRACDGDESFRDIARVLIASAKSSNFGKDVVMNKLADSLFTLALCEHACQSTDQVGLFAALADVRLARALHAIHIKSGEAWTLESLACEAGMSRSQFALHFTQVLGTPPMHYLARWRVAQARLMLRDRRLSVAAVAERLGYRSEAGLSATRGYPLLCARRFRPYPPKAPPSSACRRRGPAWSQRSRPSSLRHRS